jgi:hypothetical protein
VVFVEEGTVPDGRRRFVRRIVALSEDAEGDLVPVTHGLSAGDRVVTSGGILLSGML